MDIINNRTYLVSIKACITARILTLRYTKGDKTATEKAEIFLPYFFGQLEVP